MAQTQNNPGQAGAGQKRMPELRWLKVSRDEMVLQVREGDRWHDVEVVGPVENPVEAAPSEAPS